MAKKAHNGRPGFGENEPMFVGRRAELEAFGRKLNDPAGKVILVPGSPAMGKSELLKKMSAAAEAMPGLQCTCLRYEVTSTDGVDSLMMAIVNDAADVAAQVSGKIKSFANLNKEKLSALFSAVGTIPVAGASLKELGGLFLSLAEEARGKGNARQVLGVMLERISERLPDAGRLVLFIDPEKTMPEGCADAWRLVVKELPGKIIFVLAQRPEDVLISDPYFRGLKNVSLVPQDGLGVLSPEEAEELVECRKHRMPAAITEPILRQCLERYEGHPFAIQAAMDLLQEGVNPDELPNRPEPVEFARIIIKTIERKRDSQALSFLEAAAVIEVPAEPEMIGEVAGLSDREAGFVLADRLAGGLFRKEIGGISIYHSILSDEV